MQTENPTKETSLPQGNLPGGTPETPLPPPPKPARQLPVILIAVPTIVILLALIVKLTLSSVLPGNNALTPTPSAAINLPTPLPNRLLSVLATQSAFVALEQTVSSLSANLTTSTTNDPGLTAPVIELSLGL